MIKFTYINKCKAVDSLFSSFYTLHVPLCKKVTNRTKGIAIILMVMTHLFVLFTIDSPFFVIPLFNTGKSLEEVISKTADICVYLFSFISGYGLYHSYNGKNSKEIFFTTLTKIIRFLLCYWLVILVIFLPFYAINLGTDFQVVELVKTLFGHHGFFSYGWYVYFYIMLLITLPFVGKLLDKNKWVALVICYIPLFVLYFVLNRLQDKIVYYDILCVLIFAYMTSLVGYVFAKHNFFDLIYRVFKGKRWLILLVSGIVGISLQVAIFGYYWKGFIQPISVVFIMVFLVELFSFNVPKAIAYPLDLLGKNSMNMWYIHYIFFAPYITCYIYSDQWVLFPRIAVVSLILALGISLLIAIPFTFIDNRFIKKITL